MTKPAVNYEQALTEALVDSNESAAYLNAALEDGSQEVFLMVLRDVANARGIADLANETSLNRENLYRILSEQGNPHLLQTRSSPLESGGRAKRRHRFSPNACF
jgi:probable addiction module antidote protein